MIGARQRRMLELMADGDEWTITELWGEELGRVGRGAIARAVAGLYKAGLLTRRVGYLYAIPSRRVYRYRKGGRG